MCLSEGEINLDINDVTVLSTVQGWPDQGHCAAQASVACGASADGAHRFGLLCGGTWELLLEFNHDAKNALVDGAAAPCASTCLSSANAR